MAKYKLEIIIFLSGAIVMILELIGSRILAPYLGTSIFVWTSLIGLILAALSIGYYLGGRFSVKNPNFGFLSLMLISAALLTVIINVIKEPIIKNAMTFGIRSGSILSTLSLFFLPSIALGMISPYAIRLKIKNIDTSGSAAGKLYAISTVGSIAGTFAAGFWLIPNFGSTNIIIGLGLGLLVLSFIADFKYLTVKIIYFLLLLLIIFFSKLE
ncbi:spermidine synthase, partial [Candidatus Parcubacteria bacterium]